MLLVAALAAIAGASLGGTLACLLLGVLVLFDEWEILDFLRGSWAVFRGSHMVAFVPIGQMQAPGAYAVPRYVSEEPEPVPFVPACDNRTRIPWAWDAEAPTHMPTQNRRRRQ